MTIELDIDEALLKEAEKRTGITDRNRLIEKILNDWITTQRQQDKKGKKTIFDLAGKYQFREGYDHKALRVNREFSELLTPSPKFAH